MKVSFDRFVLDSEQRLLTEEGSPIHLPPKAFTLLVTLVTNAPRPLSKHALCDAIWGEAIVEESNLAGLVADLRNVLGDDSRTPRFIRTIHGFGYAFACEVGDQPPRETVAALVFRGELLPLERGENILGRDASTGVHVDDSTVSRRHARIVIAADATTIEDLGSKNGTFLDDTRLNGAQPLHHDQLIVLGDARLVFKRSGMIGSTITVSRSRKR